MDSTALRLPRSVLEEAYAFATAPAPWPVLILGERGTGKSTLAREIHRWSGRRGALVEVNCAAITEGLFESAFFGHEKGTFTGATGRHVGFFEEADGGTLFLDELGELSRAMQAKLLRALQDGIIRPVGGRDLAVDVRVIVATNASTDSFRPDVLDRLDALTITVPPLRDHPEDIAEIAEAIAAKWGKRLSPPSLAWLRSQPWPGNVRGLENTLHRAIALGRVEFGTLTAPTAPGSKRARAEQVIAGLGDEVTTYEVEQAILPLTMTARHLRRVIAAAGFEHVGDSVWRKVVTA